MYDLPSEDPQEPGLPDEFHDYQPEVLRLTFCPPNYSPDQVFSGSDLNLYYDIRHANWYKRPDWFGVVGVPRLYDGQDLRLSYVIWQEGVSPNLVVELLSPGTEREDLGQTSQEPGTPPSKWQVYEQILRVPYYVVFDRYTDQTRFFQLVGDRYAQLGLSQPRLWLPSVELGLGLWQGTYQGITRQWLRWYDAEDNWIPLPAEKIEQAEQRAISAEQKANQLAQRLRELGIEP
ncbi:MAG: Uma2 family endonuclease [Aphanocapsa sp. GSE-SYN-MK-11-07L]|nr:Uma2 family endonuclease [Aphanocapsa sp. GSE-SYN-MK-11-07L]